MFLIKWAWLELVAFKMAVLGRGVSMFSLITDGVLDPGEDVLTFDYLV